MNISAEGIITIYSDEIWKLHRVPRRILSDRGPQFASRFIEQLTMSRMQEVDLTFLIFFSHFYFLFNLLFIFLFLELRVRVSDNITLSHSRLHQMTQSQVT